MELDYLRSLFLYGQNNIKKTLLYKDFLKNISYFYNFGELFFQDQNKGIK